MGGLAVLKTNRCMNHADREAVARCPDCGHDFCRECVTEHDGRMLCTGCLGMTRRKSSYRRNILKVAFKTVLFMAGLCMAWLFFYMIGYFFAGLPDEFHSDGTAERSVADD